MAKFAYCRCRTLFYCLIYDAKIEYSLHTNKKKVDYYLILYIFIIYLNK